MTHNHLYAEICAFENLLRAARRAEHGQRMQDTIGRFRTDLEAELLQLRRELLTQTYTPGTYRETIITRPKRRMISAAPFRDRPVHRALCQVVMPLFERKMIFDLYSNRAGKGTHAAIRRAQQYCGQFVWPERRRLSRQNVADARRRLRWNVGQYKCGNLRQDALLGRWNSWRGHAAQADCGPLIEKIKQELKAILGATGTRATVGCTAAIGTTTPTARGAPIATTTIRTTPTTTSGFVV